MGNQTVNQLERIVLYKFKNLDDVGSTQASAVTKLTIQVRFRNIRRRLQSVRLVTGDERDAYVWSSLMSSGSSSLCEDFKPVRKPYRCDNPRRTLWMNVVPGRE